MNPDTLTLPIPCNHPCFAGHFPGNPLVPGALLTQWIVDALAAEGYRVKKIRQLKFLLPARPGDTLTLILSPGPQDNTLTLSASINDRSALSGKLELHNGR